MKFIALVLISIQCGFSFAADVPLLKYSLEVKGESWSADKATPLFDTKPVVRLLLDKNPPAGVLEWYEENVTLHADYLLSARLIKFDQNYLRLDFQILRVKEFPEGGTLYVPVCTASQLFAKVQDMELLKRVEMVCWGSQIDDQVERRLSFYLSAIALDQ